MSTAESTPQPGIKLHLAVFGAILLMVALEVFLTYQHLSTGTLLFALMTLAFISVTLGVMYFMHMKFERSILFWSLIPYLILSMMMLNHIWRDAARVIPMHVQSP